jgi:hypothetical protein
MDNRELECIISRDYDLKKFVSGVYAWDIHQKTDFSEVAYPHGYILNICHSTILKNTHWVCVYHVNARNMEWFDSHGKGLKYYNLRKLYGRNINIIENNVVIQAPNSLTCGFHCIMFLKFRWQGIPMKTYTGEIMSINLLKNDIFVVNYVKNRYITCLKNTSDYIKIKV